MSGRLVAAPSEVIEIDDVRRGHRASRAPQGWPVTWCAAGRNASRAEIRKGAARAGQPTDEEVLGRAVEAKALALPHRVKSKLLGIDTASLDYGQSTLFETHRVLYERQIPGLENLTNLDRPRGAWVVALPMKIGGGSGAPVRAIAIVAPGPF